MGNQIVVKHFEANGSAVNLPLGFVPDFCLVFNAMAAAGEVFAVAWFGTEMGDSKEIQLKALADNGTTAGLTIDYVESGAYISAYTGKSIDSGTSNLDSDPVRVTGSAGITIHADFTDDSDEVWVLAIGADKVKDEGDINA